MSLIQSVKWLIWQRLSRVSRVLLSILIFTAPMSPTKLSLKILFSRVGCTQGISVKLPKKVISFCSISVKTRLSSAVTIKIMFALCTIFAAIVAHVFVRRPAVIGELLCVLIMAGVMAMMGRSRPLAICTMLKALILRTMRSNQSD